MRGVIDEDTVVHAHEVFGTEQALDVVGCQAGGEQLGDHAVLQEQDARHLVAVRVRSQYAPQAAWPGEEPQPGVVGLWLDGSMGLVPRWRSTGWTASAG
jgi:hypothetical protein